LWSFPDIIGLLNQKLSNRLPRQSIHTSRLGRHGESLSQILFLKTRVVMQLFIKHMVSLRCKKVVQKELESAGIAYREIELGRVELAEQITQEQTALLKATLLECGLELIADRISILVESVKNTIIQMVHYEDELPKENFSYYLSQKLDYDYTYLSNVFSKVQGMSIQQYIINQRIEKVKLLLSYRELNLTEIAYQLEYSSVAHLSTQFKKVTGLSPREYTRNTNGDRKMLENI